jgi:hypothetical protein
MGRVQINDTHVFKSLHYTGIYTKDTGNDDEYKPEDFGFTLNVTTCEDEDDDLEYLDIVWDDKIPYEGEEQKHTVEGRIINNYYTYITIP